MKAILLVISILFISFLSATNYEDCNVYGNCQTNQTELGNYTYNINNSYYTTLINWTNNITNNFNQQGVNLTQMTNVTVINIKESFLSSFISSIVNLAFIQNIINSTGIYNQGGGNQSWNQSFANTLYAPNTTAGIQYLINETFVPYDGAIKNVDLGTNNLTMGDNFTMSSTGAGFGSLTWQNGQTFAFNHGVYIKGNNPFLDVLGNIFAHNDISIDKNLNVSGNIKTNGNITMNGSINLGTEGTSDGRSIRNLMYFSGGQYGNSTGDGFRIDYNYNLDLPNDDWLLFMKTDSNDAYPDGGIGFGFINGSGYNETTFKIYGDERKIVSTLNLSAPFFCHGTLCYNLSEFNSTFEIINYNINSINTTYNIQQLLNSTGIYNSAINHTEIVFNTWNSTWDNSWVNQFAYNHTSSVFTLWGQWFYNMTQPAIDYLINTYNTTWSSTYNSTYANYESNVSRNQTLQTFTQWNSTWDNSYGNVWFYNQTQKAIDYLIATYNQSWFSTYNSTYDNYALNVSRNWTADGFYIYAPNTTRGIQSLINGTNMNFANVDFNSGWTNGGVSIIDGNIYAQTGYFYNITGLNVNSLNVNGSLLPTTGWDNTFDIGSSSLRWKDLYLSGTLWSNGTIVYNNGVPITALNTSGALALTINTTKNFGEVYNYTSSIIANQSFNGRNLTLSQVANLSIGQLNWTYSLIANTSFNQKVNTSIQQYVDMINNTRTISQLYNLTASQIANISINQLNWTYSLIANTSINQIANITNQQYIDFINNTRTIGQLYNATASMIANLSLSQMSATNNLSASIIANQSINQLNWTYSLIANTSFNQKANTTIQQYVDMINKTAVLGQLYNATASMIANLSINQLNWTYSLIANTSILTYNDTIQNAGSWNESGTYTFLNNPGNYVGIGITSPVFKIDISSQDDAVGIYNVTRWGLYLQEDTYNMYLKEVVTAGNVNYVFGTTDGGTFYDNNLVLSNGKVGIGTSSPTSLLDINYGPTNNVLTSLVNITGRIAQEAGSGLSITPTLQPVTSAKVNMFGLYVNTTTINNIAGADATNYYSIYSGMGGDGDPTNAYGLYVNAPTIGTNKYAAALMGGNVGIGTTSPGRTLDVIGAEGDVAIGIGEATTGTERSYLSWDANGLNIVTLGTNNLILNSGGKVGIGTSTPTHTLNVVGDSNVTGTSVIGGNATIAESLSLSGSFYGKGSGTDAKIFHNLATYSVALPSVSGAIIIQTNVLKDSSTMTITKILISGAYSNASRNNCELTISGYWSTETNGGFSANGHTSTCGDKMRVRFMNQNSTGNVAIVLGETTTSWAYPKIAVTDFLPGHGIADYYADGWTITNSSVLGAYNSSDDVPDTTSIPATQVTTGAFSTGNYSFPHYLGIGTAIPNAPLSINTSDSTFISLNSTSASGSIFFAESGTDRAYIGYGNTGNIFTGADADSFAIRSETSLHLGAGGDGLTLTINGTTKNVGIGTTSPNVKFGVFTSAGSLPNTSGVVSSGISVDEWSNEGIVRGFDPSSPYGGWIQVQNLVTAQTTRPLLLQPVGGNLGVGLTNPIYNLTVKSGLNQYSSFHSRNTTNWGLILTGASDIDVASFIANGTSGEIIIGSMYSSYYPVFYSANAEAMRIDTSGRVGIGTKNPAYFLEVNGSSTADSIIRARTDFTSRYAGFMTRNAGGTTWFAGVDGALGDYYINTNSTSQSTAKFIIKPSGNIGINGSTAPAYNLEIGKSANSLNVSGMFYANSTNVGINVSNPGVPFQINGGDDLEPTLGSAVGGFALTGGNDLYGLYAGVSTNGDTWLQSQRNDGNTAVYDILFNPNGGNVGIGTITPSQKLDVNGTTQIATTQPYLILNDTSADEDAFNLVVNTNLFYINNKTPSTSGALFSILNTGQVGINTASPSQTLEVSNSVTGNDSSYLKVDVGYTAGAANRTAGIILGSNAANLANTWRFEAFSSSGYMNSQILNWIWTAGSVNSTRMTLTSGGLLGLGTESPEYLLETGGARTDLKRLNISGIMLVGARDVNITGEVWINGNNITYPSSGINNLTASQIANLSLRQWNYTISLIANNSFNGKNLTISQVANLSLSQWNATISLVANISLRQNLTRSQVANLSIGQLNWTYSLIANNSLGQWNYTIGQIINNTIAWNFSATNVYLNNPALMVGIGISTPAYKLEVNNNSRGLNVSGFLYANSSSVGIGTSTPTHTLNVVGNSNVTGNMTLERTIFKGGGYIYSNSTTTIIGHT